MTSRTRGWPILSPGTHHLKVPRDVRGNLAWRRHVLTECARDARLRKSLHLACSQDILFYINTFIWQYNPKKKGSGAVGPFVTWDFQEAALLATPEHPHTCDVFGTEVKIERGLLWCYEHDRSAVVEKSREMGFTWLFLILQDWLARFHDYFQSLNISRSADAVDHQSPDSLFWKIRFIQQHLPDFLKGRLDDRKMYFGYKDTKSVITGEASTGRAGVGGRAGVIFVDEFSKIKEDIEVRQRTASTADCRFFNSTHDGTETEFYKLTKTPEFTRITAHWLQHPEKRAGAYRFDARKNAIVVLDRHHPYPADFEFVRSEHPTGGPFPGIRSPWYDQKCSEIGSTRGVAIELDINVGGSSAQFFDALLIRSLKAEYVMAPLWEGDVTYDRDTGRPAGLVKLAGGPLKLWTNLTPEGRPPHSTYAAGADISAGQGATNSCLSVVDAMTGEKVAEYATATVLPAGLAPIFTALCWLFTDPESTPARFAWEHAGPGATFGKRVLDLGYRNIYYRQAHVTLAAGKVSSVPGWHPTAETKEALLHEYRDALDRRQFINRSEQALDECLEFRYKPEGGVEHAAEASRKDPTGARVNHGDRVIADALAWMMVRGKIGQKLKETPPEQEIGSLAWRRQLAADDDKQRAEAWY